MENTLHTQMCQKCPLGLKKPPEQRCDYYTKCDWGTSDQKTSNCFWRYTEVNSNSVGAMEEEPLVRISRIVRNPDKIDVEVILNQAQLIIKGVVGDIV